MDITKEDIKRTNFLFKRKKGGFQRIYFNSNENLKDIFSYFDIAGKDVLTVAGSGDQAFHFYDKGANNVDLFDNNKLALYYFYLRVWFIEYEDSFYPPLNINNIVIKKLLSRVQPKNVEELDAYNYWFMYLNYFTDEDNNWLFKPIEKTIPVNTIKDLSRVKEGLKRRQFNTYNVDIALESVSSKKYDIIYKSNISDYVSMNTYQFYINNLRNLLKEDGIIVSTNVLWSCPIDDEVLYFSSEFNYEPFPKTYDEVSKANCSLGYVYRRR